tara:strand:- start:621 stop:878 length:258 start_codon:yes stop_codon:yes gene_type:complete
MALGPKRRPKRIYERVDTNDKKFISATKETEASASYALGEHLRDDSHFEITKPILFQLQLIEEDIDEIRRFATGSGEIDVDGGSF